MKLIYISDNGSHHHKFNLAHILALVSVIIALTISLTVMVISKKSNKTHTSNNAISLQNKYESLMLKTAKLEAQVKRLNGLSKIIADNDNIDVNSYSLTTAPAVGGNDNFDLPVIKQTKLSKNIDNLELEIALEEQKYKLIKVAQTLTKKRNRNIPDAPISPKFDYTTPVRKGYVSSNFGKRRDPFNGRQRHHNGIDIAAKHGSKIHTIASGFVTFAGRKGAYGNVIDIHHSDTLKSRYAHLDKIKVKKGEVVRKADIIATMGKTGRATGPHLHLEVWKNGRPVDPNSYIDTALIQ